MSRKHFSRQSMNVELHEQQGNLCCKDGGLRQKGARGGGGVVEGLTSAALRSNYLTAASGDSAAGADMTHLYMSPL